MDIFQVYVNHQGHKFVIESCPDIGKNNSINMTFYFILLEINY